MSCVTWLPKSTISSLSWLAAALEASCMGPQTKKAPEGALASFRVALLDLGFLELDVLARDRVVFRELVLFRLGAGVLLGHVEIAGVGGGEHLDLERGGLGHDRTCAA